MTYHRPSRTPKLDRPPGAGSRGPLPSPKPPRPTAAERSAQIADASTHRVEMVPLPLRISTEQHKRLGNARDRTGISIQEHVRNAITLYLAVLEREAIELGLVPNEHVPPGHQAKPGAAA